MPVKSQAIEEPTLNLTPLIDVILVLILFFMVSSKFAEEERQFDLQVPSVSSQAAISSAPEPKIVNVYRDGNVALGAQAMTLEELTSQLTDARSQYKALHVLIRGDKQTTHGRMTEVYDACKRAGVAELAISVKLETRTK